MRELAQKQRSHITWEQQKHAVYTSNRPERHLRYSVRTKAHERCEEVIFQEPSQHDWTNSTTTYCTNKKQPDKHEMRNNRRDKRMISSHPDTLQHVHGYTRWTSPQRGRNRKDTHQEGTWELIVLADCVRTQEPVQESLQESLDVPENWTTTYGMKRSSGKRVTLSPPNIPAQFMIWNWLMISAQEAAFLNTSITQTSTQRRNRTRQVKEGKRRLRIFKAVGIHGRNIPPAAMISTINTVTISIG